jgi:large subunit ribosomal protein L21
MGFSKMHSGGFMYAVLKVSGRQYRVSPGDSFEVEKIVGAPASTLDLTEVLMVGGEKTLIGSPTVAGAKVTVVVESQHRGPKVLVFKKKRRNNYKKMQGHRSELTRLFVSEISSPLGTVAAENKPHVLDEAQLARKAERQEKAVTAKKVAGSDSALANMKKAPGKTKAAAKKSASGSKSKSGAAKKKAGVKKVATKAKK